ncbi:helix-turn-helix domain-containing protein [Streptomyces sp. NPDC049954]|uniref:winged helix-turn-helix domain-containing protein n=1 Tax=Streptomyces sp. NPDC049954 TaxID=3155779 RepID=UPI0034124B02
MREQSEAGREGPAQERGTAAAGTGPGREARLTDPGALRAYAHPTRLRLVGLLRSEGPFTATRGAELTGESVASCSYHLRMLEKYGLVEQTGGGRGREKPWRATATYTSWPEYSEDPATAAASAVLGVSVAEAYFEQTTRALERRHTLPRAWQEAEELGDSQLWMTPGELREVRDRIRELLGSYEERDTDPALRPAEARRVTFLRVAHLADQPGTRRPAHED